MAEWLRRWTWNPMGVSLAGSNPARSDFLHVSWKCHWLVTELSLIKCRVRARLAQSVEHQTFNLRVKGSSPLLGAFFFLPLQRKSSLFSFFSHQHWATYFFFHNSSVAQWKRAGPITQRSMDRNHPLLHFFLFFFFFIFQGFLCTFFPFSPCSLDSSVGRAEDCSRLCRDP